MFNNLLNDVKQAIGTIGSGVEHLFGGGQPPPSPVPQAPQIQQPVVRPLQPINQPNQGPQLGQLTNAMGLYPSIEDQLATHKQNGVLPQQNSIGNFVNGAVKTTEQFGAPLVDLATGAAKGVAQMAGAVPEYGKILAGSLTGNRQAVKNAAQGMTRDLAPAAQFTAREAAVAGLSADPFSKAGANEQFIPKPGLQQDVFGNAPVQSLASTYDTARNQGDSIASAFGQTTASALSIALAGKGAKEGVIKGVDAVHNSVLPHVSTALSILSNERGSIPINFTRDEIGRFAKNPADPDYVNIDDPVSVFNRMVNIKQELQGDSQHVGLENQYRAAETTAKAPGLTDHQRRLAVEQLANSSLSQRIEGLYDEQKDLAPIMEKHFPGSGTPVKGDTTLPAPKTPQEAKGILAHFKSVLSDQSGHIGLGLNASPDSIADTLGVTNKMIAEADSKTSENAKSASNAPRGRASAPTPEPRPFTAEERADAIKHTQGQQTINNVQTHAMDAKSVVGESEGIVRERAKRFNDAINLGDKLSEDDKNRLSDGVNGLTQSKLDNPTLFNKVVGKLRDAYDYSLSADRAGGGMTLRWNNGKYSPLYLKATQEEMDAAGIPPEDRVVRNGKSIGYKADARTIRSYQDTAREPLNANALEDARQYANQGHAAIRNRLLLNGLARLHPGEVSDDLNVKKIGDNNLVHAAKGNLPFNVSENLDKTLAAYKSSKLDNPLGEAALKGATKVSTASRKVAFLGAPLHYLNIGAKYSGLMLGKGRLFKVVADPVHAVVSAVSDKAYSATEKAMDEAGVREYNRSLGIMERETKPDLLNKGMGAKGKLNKYSLVAKSQRAMNRYTNTLSWKLGAMARRSGVELGSKDAAGVAREINQVLDTINSKAEAINPVGERLATSGSLAPHWIRANINIIRDALTEQGKPSLGLKTGGDIARSTVLGQRALEATAAIVAGTILSGQMPTFHKMLSEAGLLPSNFTPNVAGGQTNTKGQSVVTNLTPDAISIVASLLTDPVHFATARETPILSAATQFLSNTDWTGNQIADPSKPGYELTKGLDVAENALQPFAAQNLENPALTKGQAIGSMFGFRTHRNPNDPAYQSAIQYENAMQKAQQGASQPDSEAIATYLSRQVNGQGQKISPGTVGGYSNAKLLLGNAAQGGQALDRIYTAQHALGNNDPLWRLPLKAAPGQPSVTAYLTYQSQYEGPEKTGTKAKLEGPAAALSQSGWLDKLTTARNAYYGKLPASGDAAAKEPPYPTFNKQVSSDLNASYKITNTTQYDNFLTDHPDVVDAQSQIAGWENKIRLLEGAPTTVEQVNQASPQMQQVINTYNALPPSKSSGLPSSDPSARSDWIKANPQAYQAMATFYAQSSGVSLIKDAVEALYSGQNLNSQSVLKEASSLGQDVAKSGGTYSINPAAAYTASSGGSSSSSSSGTTPDYDVRFPHPKDKGPLRGKAEPVKHVQFKYRPPQIKVRPPVVPGSNPRPAEAAPIKAGTNQVQSQSDLVKSGRNS